MKRFYLFNVFYALPLFILIAFFKSEGFFMANIMRQDIIYYVAVIPVFLLVGVIGFAYQVFKVDWHNKVKLRFQIPALLTTLYILIVLACMNQIYITAGTGLIIILVTIPAVLILYAIVSTIYYRKTYKL